MNILRTCQENRPGVGVRGQLRWKRMGGRLYLENCCRQDTCSVLLQKPKLSTEVYEITGGGRVPTQQKNFLSTRAVQKWFAYVVAHCPSLEVLRQSYFLAEEVGGGGLLLNTSSSRYERPLESSLGLRFQAVIRHTPLPPVVHTRRMHRKLFFPPQRRHICAKPATSPAEPPAC